MSPRNIDVAQPYVPNVPSLYPLRYTPTPPIPRLLSEPPLGTTFAMSIRNYELGIDPTAPRSDGLASTNS